MFLTRTASPTPDRIRFMPSSLYSFVMSISVLPLHSNVYVFLHLHIPLSLLVILQTSFFPSFSLFFPPFLSLMFSPHLIPSSLLHNPHIRISKSTPRPWSPLTLAALGPLLKSPGTCRGDLPDAGERWRGHSRLLGGLPIHCVCGGKQSRPR